MDYTALSVLSLSYEYILHEGHFDRLMLILLNPFSTSGETTSPSSSVFNDLLEISTV
jgi:hypothetical protein